MSLSKDQEAKLDSIPKAGKFELDGSEEQGKSESDERIVFLYVDYGLLRVDENDVYKIWGNWSRLTSQACEDKRVDSYVSRHDMRNYDFVKKCPHHSDGDDGVWRFHIAVGGS